MSWSSRKKRRGYFLYRLFCPKEVFLTFISEYSVLNTLPEHKCFYILKNITSYTFATCFYRRKPSVSLRTERSVSAYFFKITICAVSFSNAKCIYLSLETLMIELYLHIKIYLDCFPGRLKYAKLGKSTCLTFWVPVLKVVKVIP